MKPIRFLKTITNDLKIALLNGSEINYELNPNYQILDSIRAYLLYINRR